MRAERWLPFPEHAGYEISSYRRVRRVALVDRSEMDAGDWGLVSALWERIWKPVIEEERRDPKAGARLEEGMREVLSRFG